MTQEADPETVRLVEQTVIESKAYETKKQLWGRMRGQVDRDLFDQAISQLKQNGKIMLDGPFVIYTGIDNPQTNGTGRIQRSPLVITEPLIVIMMV